MITKFLEETSVLRMWNETTPPRIEKNTLSFVGLRKFQIIYNLIIFNNCKTITVICFERIGVFDNLVLMI